MERALAALLGALGWGVKWEEDGKLRTDGLCHGPTQEGESGKMSMILRSLVWFHPPN